MHVMYSAVPCHLLPSLVFGESEDLCLYEEGARQRLVSAACMVASYKVPRPPCRAGPGGGVELVCNN